MDLDRDTIYFNVLRNALYHTARRRSLEGAARFFNFLTVLLGAAVVGDLAQVFGLGVAWAGGAVAFVGAGQLAYDPAGRAREHQLLQRDYYRLLAEMEAQGDADAAALRRFNAEMIRISGEEPPTLRGVDAKAYNDAIGASGLFPDGERLVIPFWVRAVGSFLTLDGYHFAKVSERSSA